MEKHHIKYKEIDGKDEFIIVSASEHRTLNKEAVKQRGFRIPKIISNRAHDRQREKLYFSTPLDKYAYLHESIEYYPSSGDICYSHWLTSGHFAGRKSKRVKPITATGTLQILTRHCVTLPDEPVLKKLPWMDK